MKCKKIVTIAFTVTGVALANPFVVHANTEKLNSQDQIEEQISKKNDFVLFDNELISKKNISSESMNWLQWYNSLDKDTKDMVSYVPDELSTKTIKNNFTLKNKNLTSEINYVTESLEISQSLVKSTAKAATSQYGSAPKYNPNYWNHNSRIKKANCYIYAMDVICNHTNKAKMQPGAMAGKKYKKLTKTDIINGVKADGPYLGNGRSICETNYLTKPGAKQYKVALVIAPNKDYHWYIQNSDGSWSHKRGSTQVTNVDASGKRIYNPKYCNRNYGSLNYSTFCGYFMVTRK